MGCDYIDSARGLPSSTPRLIGELHPGTGTGMNSPSMHFQEREPCTLSRTHNLALHTSLAGGEEKATLLQEAGAKCRVPPIGLLP